MITHRGTIFGTSLKKEEFFEKQIRHLSFRKGFENRQKQKIPLKYVRFIKYKLGRKTKVNQMKINMLYNKQLSYICIFSCFT